jgi:hypothetical protein
MASAAADPRWTVLTRHRDAAVRDLGLAVRLWDARDDVAAGGGDAAAMLEKAVQEALQDGYVSFEKAAEHVLDLVQEPKPEGRRWHENLLTMVTAPTNRRPALAPTLTDALDELRRFRHVAVHGYDNFQIERAAPAIAAARRAAAELPDAFETFGREFGLLPGA